MVGPALPPDLVEARAKKRKAAEERASASLEQGPAKDEESVKTTQISPARTASKDAADEDEEEEEDEDVGPMPPGDSTREALYAREADARKQAAEAVAEKPRQHSAWMTEPPKSSDWAQSIDTTKLKSRQFASSKPGRPGPHAQGGFDAGWTSAAGAAPAGDDEAGDAARDAKAAAIEAEKRRTAEQMQAQADRGPSLFDQHARKRRQLNKEDRDDPTSRPFDREKDIGPSVSSKQARDLAQRSKDLSNMFGESKYL